MRERKPIEKHDRVATYLFTEMCSNSEAGFSNVELEKWYSDALDFYEEILREATA